VTHRLAERRDRLAAEGIDARVAAFSSPDPSRDLLKLAHHQDADLILLDGARALLEGRASLADDLLAHAPADVGLYLARQAAAPGSALLVPFSGSEHDWAALELAAHIARHGSGPLVLAGSEAPSEADRDASRLLATASLVIQRTGGVTPEPILVAPGPDGILAQAARARLVVVGLSPRFRETGLGETRYQIARRAPAPVVFVRRGTRPGVLSPPSTLTRFAWSLSTHHG
jgi:nucleotide-binding universal stress UspA family protein